MSTRPVSNSGVVQVALKRLTLAEFVAQDPLLQQSTLLRAIPQTLRAEFMAKGIPKRVGQGGYIFRMGDMTGPFFLVLRGEVSLTDGSGVEAARVVKGEFFGESEIVMPAAERRLNAVTTTEVDFAEFDETYVASLLKRVPTLRGLFGEVDAGRHQARGELEDFLNRW